ncbi:MAG TPA: aldehyde-activating protein [Sneathiellales bacterium]|nr:aldehyde-activating protein [Sneathiellales bacterium]
MALNTFVESKYVKLIQGKPETLITPTNSKDGQKIVRCPSCKIALWGHYTGAGDIISFVRVGTLDDPNVLKPDIHVFTPAKQDWLQLSNDVPQVDEYYQKVDYWPIESIDRFNQVKGN